MAPTDLKTEDGTYWVRDQETWLRVDPDRISRRSDNPTGKYVACISERHVICFVVIAGA